MARRRLRWRIGGSNDPIGLGSACLASVGWAFTGIFVRWLEELTVVEITGWRMLVGAAATLPWLVAAPERRQAGAGALLQARAWALGSLLLVYYLLGVAAFRFVPVAEAALLINTTPIFVLGLHRIAGERVTSRQVAGSTTALLGVATVLLPSLGWRGTASDRLLGDGLALTAAGTRAVYVLLYRRFELHGARLRPRLISALTLLLGSSLLTATRYPGDFDRADWIAVLALGLVATALPTLTYAVAASRLAPTVTATFGLTTPILAALLAHALLAETPSVWVVVGGGLVLTGLALVLATPMPESS